MREIVVDTETTGLDPLSGHRIVEIAAIELFHHVPTGRRFHSYVNPERDMPPEAYAVHGLSEEFLAGHPPFASAVDELLTFVGDAPLVIHNAEFDMRFINAELARIGRDSIPGGRVVDTLALARRKHPGSPNSLDALCDRYRIDRSRRVKHGALLDAEILVEVYGELLGGRQRSLMFSSNERASAARRIAAPERKLRTIALPSLLTEVERTAHAEHIAQLGEGALWRRYVDVGAGKAAG